MTFWDGVIISSLIWYIVAAFCLIRGFWVGSQFYSSGWAEGFDEGWEAAVRTYSSEILEKEEGMNI